MTTSWELAKQFFFPFQLYPAGFLQATKLMALSSIAGDLLIIHRKKAAELSVPN
jgi:hypothetical protein